MYIRQLFNVAPLGRCSVYLRGLPLTFLCMEIR
jgi:hypothetical protein